MNQVLISVVLAAVPLASLAEQPRAIGGAGNDDRPFWSREDAMRAIQELAGDPEYPIEYVGVDDALSLMGPKHAFRGRAGDTFVVDLLQGYVWMASFLSHRDSRRDDMRDPLFGKVLLAESDALERASRIARGNFRFFSDFVMVLTRNSRTGFFWRARDKRTDVYLPVTVKVMLDPLTGKLTGFYGWRGDFRLPGTWHLSEQQAVATARATDESFRDAKLRVRKATAMSYVLKRHLDLWEIEALLLKGPDGNEYGPVMRTDDQSAKVWDVMRPS